MHQLLEWNTRSNLTGYTSKKEVIGNLVADSLAGVSVTEMKGPDRILDVGTGGGVPGIPLKIALPSAALTLVEKNQKKVAFLHHIIGTLGLENTNVEVRRIEHVGPVEEYHGIYDWVVIKALRLESVLPYVSKLLSSIFCLFAIQ